MTDAAELYRALLGSDRLPTLRRMTYRCATKDRCLLLDAVETPLGTVLHQTRYKYSPAENEKRSSASGRAKNTFDGVNHWRERTYYIGESALAYPDDLPSPQLGVSCDHVLEYLLAATEFRDDWSAGRVEIRVRADGSRYAVG
ncbi:hypothetical protein [Calidifontibacter indicus]|uniref:Uncharacterized protein n=1 Tax=Calidifontibacter indicus TaxID=419650 RepID=A0A3D9UMF3_9MICO|nr:hypothetical protein [Calidifontibacter indicus]REF30632.1 hypothetical protein DFJ65_1647 [Calidifontibacter indicus]